MPFIRAFVFGVGEWYSAILAQFLKRLSFSVSPYLSGSAYSTSLRAIWPQQVTSRYSLAAPLGALCGASWWRRAAASLVSGVLRGSSVSVAAKRQE